MGKPIAASDLTWLLMDRPNNLMHVNGLLVFDTLPDFEAVQEAVFERVVTRYRVLSQHPVRRHGRWVWADDVPFELDRHLSRVVLPDGSPDTLREHLSAHFAMPFDRSRAMWEMQLISGPGSADEGGVLYSRFHHGLGDGVRLVQLLLGMCDHPDTTMVPHATGGGSLPTAAAAVRHVASHSVRDMIDYVWHAGEAVERSRDWLATHNPLNLPNIEAGLELIRHPVRLTDALTSFASPDNEMSNSVREVSRMLLAEKADTGAWTGHPSGVKSVDWLAGIDLDLIRGIATRYGGTINDALLAAVSLALTAYLRERGVSDIHDLAWMMPVSLQPIDGTLPAELGNHFAVVVFSMPLGIDDPEQLVPEIHERTTRLKHSAEPTLAFGFQRFIAEAPNAVAKGITDFFSSKTIGQLTNVPGPTGQLDFAGAEVRSVLGWVPTTGDQPIGVCLFTYNNTLSIGVEVDTRMIPDARRITELISGQLDALGRVP